MNSLVMLLLLTVTTGEYLARVDLMPRMIKYLPEVLAAIIALCVIILGVRDRFRLVRPAYWFSFGAAIVVMICGAVANGLDSGPLIAGLRSYLRAIPLFLLPAVYLFTETQIRRQLMLVGAVCLLQVPISIYQRFSGLASGSTTGDMTTGTLLSSGILSTFLICATCVLIAALLRRRIALLMFVPLFVLFLLPTTINETKATVLFLPIGLLATFLAGSNAGNRFKNTVVAVSLLAVAGAIFIPIYDYFIAQKNGPTVSEFFLKKENIDRYVSKDAGVGVRSIKEVGRYDAIMTPLKEMSKDPVHFTFGLGIGNASESSLGPQFNGAYYSTFGPFLKTSASGFILELGISGLLIALIINLLIYRDSRAVAERDRGLIGTLAVGWSGLTAVIAVATFYTTIDGSVAISFLFWYFSGVVAAHRSRMIRRA